MTVSITCTVFEGPAVQGRSPALLLRSHQVPAEQKLQSGRGQQVVGPGQTWQAQGSSGGHLTGTGGWRIPRGEQTQTAGEESQVSPPPPPIQRG